MKMKPLFMYYNNISKSTGKESCCKECTKKAVSIYSMAHKGQKKEYNKEYRLVNREKYKENNRKYNLENKEKIKKYRRDNIKKVRQWRNEWQKNKRAISPQFRLNCNISGAIRRALRGRKAGRVWEDLVGYTLKELVLHLQKQFRKGMTWDNYGTIWQIDHVIPMNWYKYKDINELAFKDCWALTNLQPLFTKENLIKNKYYMG